MKLKSQKLFPCNTKEENISLCVSIKKKHLGVSEITNSYLSLQINLVAYNFKPNDLLQFILVLWHYRKYDTLSNAIFAT